MSLKYEPASVTTTPRFSGVAREFREEDTVRDLPIPWSQPNLQIGQKMDPPSICRQHSPRLNPVSQKPGAAREFREEDTVRDLAGRGDSGARQLRDRF